ncbi:Codanin-1 [Armadillidium vulgare]|nr:Codanin-1 [Armadillidium vulgare]
MESLLHAVLKSEVSSKDVISWLDSSKRNPILDEYETLKVEFVPYFLNYLREETSSIIKNCSHTGFTPNKLTSQLKASKHCSPSSYSKKSSHSGICSKAKTLNFGDASLHERAGPADCDTVDSCQKISYQTPEKTPHLNSFSYSDSPVTSQSNKFYKTSTPRITQQKISSQPHNHPYGGYGKADFSKMSERKSVLADFIVSEPVKKSQKKKNHKNTQKSPSNFSCKEEISFDLDDNEAFPVIGSQGSKKNEQKKKRINPTRVASCQETGEIVKERSRLTFGVPTKQSRNNPLFITSETKSYSFDHERKLLREEIDKLQKFDNPENKFQMKSNTLELTHNKKSINTIHSEESLSLVTNNREIQILADIYSSLILCNMVPNIMVELYFLLQLLTTEEKVNDKFQSADIFISPFNCIYFSVKTLSLLIDCLSLFDRNFLKALSDNPRVKAFDMDFSHKLFDIIENSSITKNTVKPHSKSPILSVSFQSETDNKNNFPDTLTFQSFKKQRDLFYEVLRLWEDGHLTPGWSFEQCLGNKVKQIFCLHTGLTNLTHLARLFQSQLLTMCKGNQQLRACNGAEDMSFLWQLKKQHPEKYRKLFDRLITPSQFGGPVPVPSFPGSQEFFKNFIIIASNHGFNTHLRNVLVMKITELNEMNCQISELEDKDHGDQIQDEVSSGIQSLCLLAKFLGFLEFLPYQTNDSLPDIVLSNQLRLRNKVMPPILLLEILKYGVESGCLIVVVPWMVELLSMVDAVALHTRYYLTLMFELILIYKMCYLFKIADDQNISCSKCKNLRNFRRISYGNSLFMKLRLGWLFSLPNVPEGLFFVQEEEADVDFKELDAMKRLLRLHYFHLCYSCIQHSALANITMTNDNCEEIDLDPLTLEDLSPTKNSTKKTPMKTRGV